MLEKHKGRFYIANPILAYDIDIMREIMQRVVIVRAETLHMNDTIEYYAYSDHFDELEQGEVIPEYEVIIHSTEEGRTIEFKRKE